MLLPFDHTTFINLYISNYRETTGAIFIHTNAKDIDFLFQIFCDYKIPQILQQRQVLSW